MENPKQFLRNHPYVAEIGSRVSGLLEYLLGSGQDSMANGESQQARLPTRDNDIPRAVSQPGFEDHRTEQAGCGPGAVANGPSPQREAAKDSNGNHLGVSPRGSDGQRTEGRGYGQGMVANGHSAQLQLPNNYDNTLNSPLREKKVEKTKPKRTRRCRTIFTQEQVQYDRYLYDFRVHTLSLCIHCVS